MLNINDKSHELQVSGVVENTPKNSSINFKLIAPLSFFQKINEENFEDWRKMSVYTFIRLNKSNSLEAIQPKIDAFTSQKYETEATKSENKANSSYAFTFSPLNDFHYHGFNDTGFSITGKKINQKRLSWIGILILIVACFNFMNLTNAKSSQRLKEVGVRKVLGARHFQLQKQFIFEAILISLFSLFSAIMLVNYSLPFIEQVTDYELPISWINSSIFFPLLGIALLTGILAGFYPSFLLSKLKIVEIFSSNFKIGGNNWVTKGSLIFQFALSIGLLSCTLIMYQQQAFIFNKNLGFNKETVLSIPLPVKFGEEEKSNRKLQQLKKELQQIPTINKMSGISWSFTNGNAAIFVDKEDGGKDMLNFYNIESDFIPLMEMELVKGKNFAGDTEGKNSQVIVNQEFLKKYDIDAPIGHILPKKFSNFSGNQIIGVVKDFHFENLKKEIKPVIMTTQEGFMGNIFLKISPKNIAATLTTVEQSWKVVNPKEVFEFSFLDEAIQNQYLAESRWNKVFTGATLLTILISFLGLFGLVALILAERTKEIGIRKILGASIPSINWMIAKQFVGMLLIAALVAIPIVIYTMKDWLTNFAYQIEIHSMVFLVAIVVTICLTSITIAFQSTKAALKNPIETLKME